MKYSVLKESNTIGSAILRTRKGLLRILDFHIDPEYRSKGLGRLLMQKIIEDNTGSKIHQYVIRNLYVEKFNLPAEVLSLSNKEFLGYLSHKVEVSAELKDFYKSVDKVLYGKDYQKEDMLKIKILKLKV